MLEDSTTYYFSAIQQDTLMRVQTSTVFVRTGFAGDERQVGYPSSVTLFIVCGLALFAIIKYNFGKNLLEAFQSLFNYRLNLRMFEERRESDRQAALLLNVLFSLVVGIFISLIFPFFGATPLWGSQVLSIVFFSVVALLLYVLKAQIWRVMGVVFMTQSFSKIYINSMFLHNQVIGFLLFPIVAIIPYIAEGVAPYAVYGVIAIFALFYLFKLFRIFQIIHDQNVSFFYFILYLCALEILPLLLFAKGCKMLIESIVL